MALAVGIAGCEHRTSAPPASQATSDTAVAPESAAAPAVARWDARAFGPALFVPGDSAGRALVILPDTSASTDDLPDTVSVRLMGRGGAVQPGRIVRGPAGDSTECPAWRVVAPAPAAAWGVAFDASDVAPIPLDSIRAMPRADSMRLAAAVTRLASAIRDDPQGRFTGLPFSVRSAWMFPASGGRQVVVATLQRVINQEASPLQEHTLVIAERDARPGAVDDSWTTAYSERSSGDEETVETRELLAAVEVGAEQEPLLVLSRDFGDHIEYGLLQREGPARWRARWSGSDLTC